MAITIIRIIITTVIMTKVIIIMLIKICGRTEIQNR